MYPGSPVPPGYPGTRVGIPTLGTPGTRVPWYPGRNPMLSRRQACPSCLRGKKTFQSFKLLP
eukprot:2419846-Rhodomonas_salina.1